MPDEKEEDKLYVIPRVIKEHIQWLLAKAYGLDGVDSCHHKQEIIMTLLNIPEVRLRAVKQFTEPVLKQLINNALKNHQRYETSLNIRNYVRELRISAEEIKRVNIDEMPKMKLLIHALRKNNVDCDIIQYDTEKLLITLLYQTDLIHLHCPNEWVLDSKQNKMSFVPNWKAKQQEDERSGD